MASPALASLPPIVIAPPALATAPSPEVAPQPAAAHPFAELLRQNRIAASTVGPAGCAGSPPTEDDAEASAPAAGSGPTPSAPGTSTARPAVRPRAKAPGAPARSPSHADAGAAAGKTERGVAERPERAPLDAPGSGMAVDAALAAQATAHLHASRGTTGAGAGGRDAALADAASGPSGANGAEGGDLHASRLAGREGAGVGGSARFDATLAASAESLAASAMAASDMQRADTEPLVGPLETTPVLSAASSLATIGAPTAGGASAASSAGPVDVALATPVASPDFAQALGVEVSVLAKDGVQRAELHLHPVETGPISVHIRVEGTQAQVDFGADAAATRRAIEAGLPELASALRDAGLTLHGGGVSSHAGGRDRTRDGEFARSGDGAHGATASAVDPGTARPARTWITRAGGVDLYA